MPLAQETDLRFARMFAAEGGAAAILRCGCARSRESFRAKYAGALRRNGEAGRRLDARGSKARRDARRCAVEILFSARELIFCGCARVFWWCRDWWRPRARFAFAL